MAEVTAPPADAPPLSLADFVPDPPWTADPPPPDRRVEGQIAGVRLIPLTGHRYGPGRLFELLTLRPGADAAPPAPIVHVYRVDCAPGSRRGWVWHERQEDRLAFTEGDVLLVLLDLRDDSPTRGAVNEIALGGAAPTLAILPRGVVHAVWNRGGDWASFVNLPTAPYDPAWPDKRRLPLDDPRIPYRWPG